MSTTVTIPITDTYISSPNADTNYATAATWYWYTAKPLLARADLSSLVGKVITAASLFVRNATGNSTIRTYTMYRILAANSGWTVAQSTWNHADAGDDIHWAGDTGADGGADAGCSVAGTDYANAAMGTYNYPGGAYIGYNEIPISDLDEFSAMIAANHGFIVTSTAASLLQWYLTDNTGTDKDPYLSVTYSEPAAGAGLGGLAALGGLGGIA